MDRNDTVQIIIVKVDTSLSARRAWIEMDVKAATGLFTSVALRKESVDRNTSSSPAGLCDLRRSPQGERG